MSSLKSLSFIQIVNTETPQRIILQSHKRPQRIPRFFLFFFVEVAKATCLNFPHYSAPFLLRQHFFWTFFIFVFISLKSYFSFRDFTRSTNHIIIRMITNTIKNISHKGHTTMVFSKVDTSPKIFTVCFALKIPIIGKLHCCI